MPNPFTALPPKVRQGLYMLYALAGLVFGAFLVYGTDHLGDLDINKALQVLAYVGIPFGFTAAANVPSLKDAVEHPEDVRDDLGASDLVTVLVVCLVVIVVIALLTRLL